MIKQYLETGKIVGTHGVRGMVRVQPWCDSGDFLCSFRTLYTDAGGKNKLKVISAKPHGNVVIMALENVNSIEDAEKLRGSVIYIDRRDTRLPEGRYFISDLLGCGVTHADTGEDLGVITDISSTGANDVWHITRDGREYLVPAIDDVIVTVNPAGESVVIRPLKGIFDHEN